MILQDLDSRPGIAHVAIVQRDASAANEEMFKKEMMKLLQTADLRYVVLNLENVGYMDSTFLGGLVACLKQAIASGRDIILVSLKKDIMDLLMLIRMDKVFKIYKDYEEALTQI